MILYLLSQYTVLTIKHRIHIFKSNINQLYCSYVLQAHLLYDNESIPVIFPMNASVQFYVGSKNSYQEFIHFPIPDRLIAVN